MFCVVVLSLVWFYCFLVYVFPLFVYFLIIVRVFCICVFGWVWWCKWVCGCFVCLDCKTWLCILCFSIGFVCFSCLYYGCYCYWIKSIVLFLRPMVFFICKLFLCKIMLYLEWFSLKWLQDFLCQMLHALEWFGLK